jgi:hypothetical protein
MVKKDKLRILFVPKNRIKKVKRGLTLQSKKKK